MSTYTRPKDDDDESKIWVYSKSLSTYILFKSSPDDGNNAKLCVMKCHTIMN